MIKKLVVVIFFLGIAMLLTAPLFAEENTTANPTDTSAKEAEAAPKNDATLADEETLPAEEGVGEGVVTGEVTVLDTSASSISIKGPDGAEKAFSVVDGETILWKGIEDIKLSDVKKGDNAEVGYYTDDAGKLVASWVDVVIPEQPATGTKTTPVAPVTSDENK